jgi:hypothetical protein
VTGDFEGPHAPKNSREGSQILYTRSLTSVVRCARQTSPQSPRAACDGNAAVACRRHVMLKRAAQRKTGAAQCRGGKHRQGVDMLQHRVTSSQTNPDIACVCYLVKCARDTCAATLHGGTQRVILAQVALH